MDEGFVEVVRKKSSIKTNRMVCLQICRRKTRGLNCSGGRLRIGMEMGESEESMTTQGTARSYTVVLMGGGRKGIDTRAG